MANLLGRLEEAMMLGLRDVIDEIFLLSQINVPVDKGTLKKSAVVRRIPGGWEIAYRAPHAAANEFGFEAHEQMVRRHSVREHHRRRFRGRRLSPTKRISVRAHYRGPFQRHMPGRRGRHYLGRAVAAVRPRIGTIVGRRLNRRLARMS